MKLYRTVITCLALVSATGYAEKPTADEIQKYLAFFEKFAATIVADKDDCGKMATDANALLDANQALLKTAQAQQGQMKDLSKADQDRVKAAGAKMMDGMKNCVKDKAVQAAFARLHPKK